MIKKLFIVMLVFTLVLAVAAVALADTGRWLNAEKNYQSDALMSAATNKHGTSAASYGVTTNKCSFCHAVHNAGTDYAGTNAYKLLRTQGGNGSVAYACLFCHDRTGLGSVPQPYAKTSGTTRAIHRVDGTANSVPDSTGPATSRIGSDGVLDCKDCHNAAPHGAATVYKLTKDSGASSGYVRPICIRCHNKNNVEQWDGQSHILTVSNSTGNLRAAQSSAQSFTGARVYFSAGIATTRDCASCHANTGGTAGGGLFPHISEASRFLTTVAGNLNEAGSGGSLDAVCVGCHRFNTDGSPGGNGSGVGIDF